MSAPGSPVAGQASHSAPALCCAACAPAVQAILHTGLHSNETCSHGVSRMGLYISVRCRFFLYILILFLTNQASIMGFRAIAAVCRAVVVSNMVCCQQRTPLTMRAMPPRHLLIVGSDHESNRALRFQPECGTPS